MKKILLTIGITIIVLIAVSYLYIISGSYDISQLSPHNKLTLSIIKMTTHNSIDARLDEVEVPNNLKDSTLILTGFKHYNEMCSMCHAGPGIERNEMAEGLYPKPPKLYKFANEDDAQEFFWIIKNGIKMTSMPALAPTHTDDQIWAITAFVTNKLGKMSPEEYKEWTEKYSEEEEM